MLERDTSPDVNTSETQCLKRDRKASQAKRIVEWLRAWVLFSLPGSVMGRETVYLRDFSELMR